MLTNNFFEFKIEEVEGSIVDRFERQVCLYPQRIAVKTRKSELTYDELNRISNRLSWTILKQWDRGGKRIGLLFENDYQVIASMLGVLKSGNTYVPLDPLLPKDRSEYVLQDSQASYIITDKKNLSLAKELSQDNIPIIFFDDINSNMPDKNTGLNLSPDTYAWIIYTSGSTGQPKGVIQNHRNVLHYVMNYTNGFGICPDDGISLLYSCSVNAGAHCIFSALLNGASIHNYSVRSEGFDNLADWIIQQGITIYISVPTVFQHFADTLKGNEKFPKLRFLVMLGEPVYIKHFDLYKKYFAQNCVFVNRLGSTETGTIRWNFINKETQIDGINVPVGYPVRDNEILILDKSGNQVGFGEVGEIAVKSKYLSPGYWGKPELTQKVFLSDPEDGDKRTYFTGDMGFLNPDGCLVHLGRKDFQIKIKGYRIEPAEIEMALLKHNAIKDAVVWSWGDQDDEKRLVAYIIPDGMKLPTASELRRFLKEVLPEYMIPSRFIPLESFPTAPNGKINRRALPMPDSSRPDLETPYVAPAKSLEKLLASIWSEVLGLEKVGIYDNFFDLGGNSLLATKIVSRVSSTLGINIPLKLLFQSSNISDMTTVIAKSLIEKTKSKDIEDILAELEG